jgi:hypothetical protein
VPAGAVRGGEEGQHFHKRYRLTVYKPTTNS